MNIHRKYSCIFMKQGAVKREIKAGKTAAYKQIKGVSFLQPVTAVLLRR